MENPEECTTAACTRTGETQFSGKCDKCFHGNKGQESEKSVRELSTESGIDEVDAGENLSGTGQGARICVVSGCRNYGNPVNNYLCNSCLSYIQKEIAGRGYTDDEEGSCLTPKCPNDSHPGQFCNECKKTFSTAKPILYTSQVSRSKCITTTCNNYGNVEKGNLCNECFNKSMKGAVGMCEPLLCSTPDCSRVADVKFDWKCEQCYNSRSTVCKTPHCRESVFGGGEVCSKCALQMSPGLCVLASGGGDTSFPSYAQNPVVDTAASTASTAGDATDMSSFNKASLNMPDTAHGLATDWKQCLTPGCGNIGSSAGKGLCSECYIKQVKQPHTPDSMFLACITHGCRNQGHQHLKGFCQHCFSSGQNLDSSKIPLVPRRIPKKCITPDCQFFGVDEQGGRCSQCFNNYLGASAATATSPAITINSELFEFSEDLKCKTQGCEFYGNTETMDLCSGCFRRYLEDNPNPPERRRHATGPSTYSLQDKEAMLPLTGENCTSVVSAAGEIGNPKFDELPEKIRARSDTQPSSMKLPGSSAEIPKHHLNIPDIHDHSPSKPTSSKGTHHRPLENQTAVHIDSLVFASSPVNKDPTQTQVQEPFHGRGNEGKTSSSPSQPSSISSLPLPREPDLAPSEPQLVQNNNSDELFGSGRETKVPQSAIMKRSVSVSGGFTVLEDKCKTESCERRCVAETFPYCMSCKEALEVQPHTQTASEPVSMPLSPQTTHILQSDQNRIPKFSSNPNLPSLSDICESPGCANSVSSSHYPLCVECAEQNEQQGKALPTEQNPVQDDHRVAFPPQETVQKRTAGKRSKGGPSSMLSGLEKKKVSLKPVYLDPCNITCDVIICLWNKYNIDRGMHPLLAKVGNVIPRKDDFKAALLRDEVCETPRGKSKAVSILHCKYDLAADRQIANALLRCVLYTESKRKTSIVLPVQHCDDLIQNPAMATRVCMYVISHLQTTTGYTQSLEKFIMCVGSADIIKQCKEEFVAIDAKKRRQEMPAEVRPNCHKCKSNPSAKLKPLSNFCDDPCGVFCIPCLKHGRKEGLICPHHGPCFSPVGHENTFAILVAGFDRNPKVAEIFIQDTDRMERALANNDYIGISCENIKVVKPKNPGKEEDIKGKVMEAFSSLRRKVRDSKHAIFYFYYSGHNDTKALKLGLNNRMTPKELKQQLRTLDVENILIILDCCYSGGASLTEDISSEDFTSSLGGCSKDDDSEPLKYLPKLWNLEGDLEEDGSKGSSTQVYQWASSVAEEKSYFKNGQSFFTHCIVQALKGHCPSKQVGCEACRIYKQKVVRADGVFLSMIHESVMCHVPQLAERSGFQQHPQLESSSSDEEKFLFAFHFCS